MSCSGTPAFNEICGLAREIRTDLIVMPTHGRTGLEHMFLGSTAERTVRHSPCPVFIMRYGQWLLRKEGWLQKDSCAGRFLRLLTRRTAVRDEIRRLLWREGDSAACD